ncbi:DUF4429 domain-containing protein, partial [Streptomyces sviceus]|uniref:DUF4429 domain-containing protein n=1 Tax=Streptomyces sviceus TaxID=285530 RepID=UPI003681043B
STATSPHRTKRSTPVPDTAARTDPPHCVSRCKRWHISQISSIQWKPAGPLVNGFIQLSASGGNERRSKFGSQTTSAASDENSVIFTKKQQADFETLRAALDTAVAQQHAGPAVAASSVADEITKLAGLRERGLISDEEFEARKRRLLDG